MQEQLEKKEKRRWRGEEEEDEEETLYVLINKHGTSYLVKKIE